MFITERTGAIKIVPPGASQVTATPLLTLTNINIDQGERGLVGMTLDPNFATNGYYYLFFTANSPLRDRVSRFTASGDTTLPGSEVVIWQDNVDAGFWHHAGNVAFGPDGNPISTGDHFDQTSGSNHPHNGSIVITANPARQCRRHHPNR
jgi:glucose/arabinose dehydrogenase